MKKVAHIAAVLALGLWALAASEVQAQSNDVALARHLFEEGIEFVDQEAWNEAADRFQRSLDLRSSPIVAYNLGSTLVELGRLVEASEAFRRATLAAAAPLEVSRAARESIAEIEPRIGLLTVEVLGDPTAVTFFVDDRPLPSQAIGVGAPIDPGTWTIRAVRDDSDVATARVDIGEGSEESVTLEIPERETQDDVLLGGMGAPATGTAAEEEGGGVFSSPWFWVGVGAVLAGAAAVILAFTLGGQGDTDPVSGNLMPGIVEF